MLDWGLGHLELSNNFITTTATLKIRSEWLKTWVVFYYVFIFPCSGKLLSSIDFKPTNFKQAPLPLQQKLFLLKNEWHFFKSSIVTLTNLLWAIKTYLDLAHTDFIVLHNYLDRGCYFFCSVLLLVWKWNDTVTRAMDCLLHWEAFLKHHQINSYIVWTSSCHMMLPDTFFDYKEKLAQGKSSGLSLVFLC